ncbi:Hrp-dependent type III effector protein [Rhizobium sullae]|uniref:Hrp-dependent type III effector protein n=1 Tax=Rhizobium sullae TaxID=50338 RepID=A0A2N0DBP0_RHISU|nr:four-carbon acid sugar kinase family protein [Rhizobium sullae]PKA43494.1 Hrp-dependent type III effector protein [Rhizobium sullae]
MLAILADDLTGALDSAAPFATRGMHVEVALATGAIGKALCEAPDVLSINLGSREIGAPAARRQVEMALAALPAGTRLFKKVDSRLKGHIAAELDAMSFRAALAAPAIPAFGRVVKDGCVTGFGVDTPISIAEKLGHHAACATIPDMTSQSEMHAWLDQSESSGFDLLIGARGLAEALAERLSGNATARTAGIPSGKALFVIGSRDPITVAQIDALRAAFALRYLPAPNGHLAGGGDRSDGSVITLVQAVPGEGVVGSHDVSRFLAESVFPDLTNKASTLLFAGGATAEAVLERMGITRFRLLGECMPGLGLAHAHGHCIIAKSGGFGHPDTLKEIAGIMLRNMG